MIDTYFRRPYQLLLVTPLLGKLAKTGLTPLHLTLASLMIGLLTLPAIIFGYPVWAVALMVISGYLDTLDGSLARLMKTASPQGAVLDIFADRLVEISIVLGLYFYEPTSRSIVCLFMLSAILICITSFLAVGIFEENQSFKSFHYSPGIIERAEAFIFFGGMILFPSAFGLLGLLFAILVTLTGLVRVYKFYSES